MNFFGFNITRSKPSNLNGGQTGSVQPATRSVSAAAWLRGDDIPDCPPVRLGNAFEQITWVYRAATVLAEQVANTPFLFSHGERGREKSITSGPLIEFYNRPHPNIDRFQYWELRVLWLLLRGECFRIPIYDEFSKKLKNVLILNPDHFYPLVENHELTGWRYTGNSKLTPIESQIFLPHEVWHDKLPNPFNPWRGMSPLLSADLAMRTDLAAAYFMRGYIENNADIGLIVRTQDQLDDVQKEQIMTALRNRKRTAGTADRPLLLSTTCEVIQPKLSSADLQFLENRKFSRAEICAALGVPEEIVCTTDHNKYDVMHGARLNFIENRVAPLCARLEAAEQVTVRALDHKAIGWFDIENLPIMQEARRNRLATAKIGFDMGIPFNELNRLYDLGFPQLPWGDTGYIPGSLLPAGILPPAPTPPPVSAAERESLREFARDFHALLKS